MSAFFSRNIGKRGRVARGLIGVALLVAAHYCGRVWLSGMLTGAGIFGVFEAIRGWCLLRACGVKTPL